MKLRFHSAASTLRFAALLVAGLMVFLSLAPALASEIRLLAPSSITSETAAGPTHPAAVSSDGRFVLLRSVAPNLIARQFDQNGAADVFLRDRLTGQTTLISHAASSPWQTGDFGSLPVAMSPDGEFVLFTSWAGNLIAGLTHAAPYSTDVYLWRRSDASLTLVSHLAGESLHAAGFSRAVALTPDGASVLFESEATGLAAEVSDLNEATDVFLYSLADGESQLVSVALPLSRPPGSLQTGNGRSKAVGLTRDGSEVLFNSLASDLVDGDDSNEDAFVRHIPTSFTNKAVWGARSTARAFTPNGRWVLLDTEDHRVLRVDRVTLQQKTIASGNGLSSIALSDEGSRVLFDQSSQAYLYSDEAPQPLCLSCGETFGSGIALTADGRFALYSQSSLGYNSDLILYDSGTGTTTSLLPAGTQGVAVGGGFFVGWSSDGQWIVLAALDASLVPGTGDRNNNYDTFLLKRGELGAELLSPSAWPGPIATTLGGSSEPTGQSADGEAVLFRGPAYLADPDHPSPDSAAWAYDAGSRELRLLSPLPGQPQVPAPGTSRPLALASDGRVLLTSDSTDLIAGGSSLPSRQLYLYSPESQTYRLLSGRAGSPGEGTAGKLDKVRFGRELNTRVFFTATNADLVAGLAPLEAANLFACSLKAAGCELLSADGTNPHLGADRWVEQVRVSANGSVVAFASPAHNLLTGDSLGISKTFLWREGEGLELLSHAAGAPDQPANGGTWPDGLSADGRFVLVTSNATNLDPALIDNNGTADVFVLDRALGTAELVSSNALFPDVSATGYSDGITLSEDGRFVLFFSSATDLVPGQEDESGPFSSFEGAYDLFVYDRNTHQKKLVSHAPGQSLVAAGYSPYGYLSQDGSRVAFLSGSPLLAPRGIFGLYLWDSADQEVQTLYLSLGGPYIIPGAWPIFFDTLFFDGSLLPINSFADNVAPQQDTNGFADAFVVLLDPLFRDGFESGNTRAWTTTVP